MAFDFLKRKKKNTKKIKKRNYQGGSKSTRLSRWYTNSTDADTAIFGSITTLRDRARDLRRNNPYVARAVSAIANNTIGSGIKTQIKGSREASLQLSWDEWTKSKEFSYEKDKNYYQMQNLALQSMVESGEVLIRRYVDIKRKYPYCYQMLEGDYIDTSRDNQRTETNNRILQGIEYNEMGQKVAFWLYENHPGNYSTATFSNIKSVRVPAEDVRHLFRTDRPGQTRGVTWIAPVMIRVKDLDDYEDAELMRQKIAACFAAFVKDISGDIESEDECDMGDKIEPAMIEFLPPGKDVVFPNPPTVENYKEYTTKNLKAIATGLGVSYEVLTFDLSDTNYSSGRMGHLEFNRNIQTWRQHTFIPGFIDPIVEDFKDMISLLGGNAQEHTFSHVQPRREMIDPVKEVPAMINAIRGGLTPLSEAILSNGGDPEEAMARFKADNDLLDKLGLVFDSDARRVSKSGNAHNEEVNNEEEN